MTQTGQIDRHPALHLPRAGRGHPGTAGQRRLRARRGALRVPRRPPPVRRDTPIASALAHVREPLPPLPSDVPEHLRAVVDQALAKDPAHRSPPLADLAAALRGGADHGSAAAAAGRRRAAGAAGTRSSTDRCSDADPRDDRDARDAATGAAGTAAGSAAPGLAAVGGRGRGSCVLLVVVLLRRGSAGRRRRPPPADDRADAPGRRGGRRARGGHRRPSAAARRHPTRSRRLRSAMRRRTIDEGPALGRSSG